MLKNLHPAKVCNFLSISEKIAFRASSYSCEDASVYDATFLSNLIHRTNVYDTKPVAMAGDNDVFAKKMILMPFHRRMHWSLVAVLNPGAIKSCKERGYKGGTPCILFLDPLGTNTKHDKSIIASKLLIWLNRQWRDRPGAREDDGLHRRIVHGSDNSP